MPEDSQGGASIPTNLRLLLLLEEVAKAGEPVTPAEANAALGLPKPTIHRLLQTLEAEGFVERHLDGRSFGPGRRLWRLSANVLSSSNLRTARMAILRRLADEVGETCNIAAPGAEGMVYLDRVETKWPLRIQLPIGSTVPFHCTASGKMRLAALSATQLDRILSAGPLERRTDSTIVDPAALRRELRAVRKAGYATDAEEFMEGMAAIAAPIRDAAGRFVATVSIHAPVQRQPVEKLKACLPVLSAAAEKLSALLAGR
ncbi:MAG: IclR family transcriptional regulator [Pseudomonadota bacterium]